MATADQDRQAQQHPAVKWVLGASQTLGVAFICWLVSNIGSSVTAFSTKLDGVATSIAAIAQKQVLQEREAAQTAQRVSRVEGKLETLEQRTTRLTFVVEQLEKENGRGR